jgi:protein-disulfide isomerase
MKLRRALAIALLAALPVIAAACGDDDAANGPGAASVAESPTPSPTPASLAEAVAAIDYPLDQADGRAIGAADAPHHLQVFVDFRCPHCLEFTARIEPMLIDEYVDDGLLLLEIRDFPVLGAPSIGAAVAARCAAEQDAFWPYHKGLFEAQATGAVFDVDLLIDLAVGAGADAAEFEACMTDLRTLPEVEDDYAAAQAFGLTGTPGFVLNGQALSSPPATVDAWRQLLDQ